MAIPFLAQAQPFPPAVSYVDNEFVALQFSGFSTSSVTTLERIALDQAVVATRMDALLQVVRDTGLTPGVTYSYRTRVFFPGSGNSFTSAPVSVVAGEVQGTLDQSMTWEGTRLLRGGVTVPTNVTLTVAPNAVVGLRTNFSGVGGLDVFGRLEAREARFHNSTNNPDSFGFRITSGGGGAPPFGSMLLSNYVFRQCFIVASHGLEWGGNTTDLTHLRQSIPAAASAKPAAPRKALIYNFTRGTYHDEAIMWATRALELMGEKTGAFTTTASFDASVFTPEKLRELCFP